jgi:hypothetical protein
MWRQNGAFFLSPVGIPAMTRHSGDRGKGTAMVDVPLSEREIELIRYVIERYRKAMLFEIANTDSRDLRQYLQQREDVFEALVQKLESFAGQPDVSD